MGGFLVAYQQTDHQCVFEPWRAWQAGDRRPHGGQTEDQVCVLLELEAPGRDGRKRRAPGTLEVVLDRSGSMADGHLEAAKDALEALLARVDPSDKGLVTFDDAVEVAVPAGPLADKEHMRHLIRGLYPVATTNLSGGLLRGSRRRDG